MEQSIQRGARIRRGPGVRIAAVAFAAGGLTISGFVVGTAGAVTSHAAKSVVVSTAKIAKIGTVLVSGKTLYTLAPSKTGCNAACLKIWPELVLPSGVTKATAGTGVTASKLGTIMRANGVRQVTYGGKPLYWFTGDKVAGKVNGNLSDKWGKWSDIVTVKSSSSGGSTGGSTGGTTAGTGGAAF